MQDHVRDRRLQSTFQSLPDYEEEQQRDLLYYTDRNRKL